jgi:hypothetical protein
VERLGQQQELVRRQELEQVQQLGLELVQLQRLLELEQLRSKGLELGSSLGLVRSKELELGSSLGLVRSSHFDHSNGYASERVNRHHIHIRNVLGDRSSVHDVHDHSSRYDLRNVLDDRSNVQRDHHNDCGNQYRQLPCCHFQPRKCRQRRKTKQYHLKQYGSLTIPPMFGNKIRNRHHPRNSPPTLAISRRRSSLPNATVMNLLAALEFPCSTLQVRKSITIAQARESDYQARQCCQAGKC